MIPQRSVLHVPATRRSRLRAIVISAGLILSLTTAATVQATHALGTLDCGSAGTFAVDGQGPLPAGFEAPGPWSGLFLLEGTTQVFRAVSIQGQFFRYQRPAAGRYPGDVITCTLTSSGPGFPGGFWTLEGVLIP